MKFASGLLLVLLSFAAIAHADVPATNAPPMAPTPAPAAAPAASAPALKLDDYINDLATTLKLSDDEKKAIQADYLADGALLKNTLNNDSLSPLQQAQQVADLREARNAKIEALLNDLDRQQAFLKIEARYRVALTELAADGGFAPASAPAPAATAAPTTNAPAAAK